MMFSNHHHPSTATHHHHHSQLLEEVAHLSNANSANHNIAAASATNSNLIMPHFLNDDITYSSSSSNHPPINHQTILMAHHHHFNHNNQYSSLNQSIINQEQFPQLIISTIGTPPPIHQQQHQSKSPTNRHTAISHSIKSLTKMTNGQSKKITRNDSSSSSSSSSSTMTKSKSNNHHNSNHPQQCKVCGDIPIGKNFGVVTCGSCKIFFSRNIDSKERLQCRNHNRCMDLINKSNRRNCSACRLDKCIRLGMRVKRNRQKQLQQQSLSIGSPSMKILRNPNRSLSESSPSNHNHLININENYHHHHPHHNHEFNDQNSSQAGSSSLGGDDDDEDDDIEINEISSDDYHDIPNLIPMESIANSGQSTLQNEFNYLSSANHNHNHRSDSYDLINVDCNKSTEKNSMLQQQQQPIRSESIIQLLSHQQQRQQQPLFNSVSVIQQAPPSRPSSSAALIINNNNNNNDNVNSNSNSNDDSLMAEDLDNENDNDDVIEIQDISQSIPANNNNNNDTATFSQQQRQPSTSKSEDTNNNEKYDNNNKMLVPFNNNQNRSLIDIVVDDEEDLDSLEQMTHDVFNYSHVQSSSSLNEHTRYNYNNFYEENYCKYYYTPANSNTYHHNDHSNGSNKRGIFYANKSFKLYEEFWRVSEISELIRQNESGFFKKKNNLLHMLYHLRGVQNFDDNLNAWAIFNGVNDNGFTMIKLDMFQQSIKKEMSVAHRQYIKSFPQEWRKDPTVFNLMTYLLLFSAFDRPHSPFKCDKLTYFQYLYLFKRYFECMYQDEELAQQMLLWMLKLIRQLSPLCSECLTACTHSLNPAVLKKIGPNYAQCLMMEEKQKKTIPSSTSTSSNVSMESSSNDNHSTLNRMVTHDHASSVSASSSKCNKTNDQLHNHNNIDDDDDEPMMIVQD
ncbi:Nuclear receptor sub 3, group C, member 2 [Dermatophagoides pteronyssinus]|uniref:Nuclear receptor sub 3, group C, member 2 n=1 Tax=Dermatophagoides pteronyssinus TaxID=6956 RepID=A0ABQ8JCZ9_DERPT|nr:Nuclear receptor sub 3, group C, member 2 [Dermatophagoides pteronyssinus]